MGKLSKAAARMGSVRSERKAAAARANSRTGGRPMVCGSLTDARERLAVSRRESGHVIFDGEHWRVFADPQALPVLLARVRGRWVTVPGEDNGDKPKS